MPDRVVINCRPGDAEAGEPEVLYSIGPNRPQPLGGIDRTLGVLKDDAPELKVVIRADRRLHYDQVRAVMKIVAARDIEMLNVVAHAGEGGEEP